MPRSPPRREVRRADGCRASRHSYPGFLPAHHGGEEVTHVGAWLWLSRMAAATAGGSSHSALCPHCGSRLHVVSGGNSALQRLSAGGRSWSLSASTTWTGTFQARDAAKRPSTVPL